MLCLRQCYELLATVFHIFKEVETCATGAEQHGVARLCKIAACFDTFFHGVCVGDRKPKIVEVFVKFGVVGTKINEGATLLADDIEEL